MKYVKIGVDQWAVADSEKVELITAGLTGCVALAIYAEGRIGLTHIMPDAPKKWKEYTAKLDNMIEALEIGDTAMARIVHSDDNKREVDFAEMVREYCSSKKISDTKRYFGSGCRVYKLEIYVPTFLSDGKKKYTIGLDLKEEEENKSLYIKNFFVVSEASILKYLIAEGKLSEKADDATKAIKS